MRRHLTTLLTTILPAAIIVWIIITIFLTNPWAPAVSDEAFDRITDDMSIEWDRHGKQTGRTLWRVSIN